MVFHILFMLEPLFLFRLLFLYFYGFSILLSWKVCNISYCGHFIKQYLTFCFDVMTCFSLISRWCSFIRRLTILPVSLIYLPAGTREYFCVHLSGDLWSWGFLKSCPIFLSGLKIVRILCLFNILPIWSVVPLTYGRINRILLSDYQRPLFYLHV